MKYDCWADPVACVCALAKGVDVPVWVARLNTGQKIKLSRIVVAISGQVRGMIAEDVGGSWDAAERLGDQLEELVRRFVRLREPVTVGDYTWATIDDVIALRDPNLLAPFMWLLHEQNSVSLDLAKNSSSPLASAPGSGDSQSTVSGDAPAPVAPAAERSNSAPSVDVSAPPVDRSGMTTATPTSSA